MMATSGMQQRVKPESLNQDTNNIGEIKEPAPEESPYMKASEDPVYIKDPAPEETPCEKADDDLIKKCGVIQGPSMNNGTFDTTKDVVPEESAEIKKSECDSSLQSPAELDEVEKQTQKRGSKWEEFPVEKWRSAVYVNRAYFGQLCDDQNAFVIQYAEQIKLSGHRVSLIEVGCGTGEFVRDTADNFRVAVGVDFNPHFIGYCNHEIPEGRQAQQRYIHGDACKLVELMAQHFPKEEGLLWDDVRVVACVGNTIGIIPQELKETVYNQMLDLAGEQGILVMSYWNARWFGDAVLNFYHANPQLCGEFKGESIDLSTTTLTTPSGYRTHWTSVAEAREVMEGLGAEIISIKDQGKGVLVAARRLPKEDKKFTPPPRPQAQGVWYGYKTDSDEEDEDQ
jgi:SAM-dependent methyltransferase